MQHAGSFPVHGRSRETRRLLVLIDPRKQRPFADRQIIDVSPTSPRPLMIGALTYPTWSVWSVFEAKDFAGIELGHHVCLVIGYIHHHLGQFRATVGPASVRMRVI